MSDSVREALDALIDLRNGAFADYHADRAGIEADYQLVKSALSANGGEVEPVAWAVFADNGNIRIWGREKPEAFPEAVPLYLSPTVKDFLTVQSEPIGYADPDSLNDYRAGDRLHIPVYRPDASEEWQSGIPVYLHPAAPSVAVPDGWKLVPVKVTREMCEAAAKQRRCVVSSNMYATIREAILAAPSPDHIADAGKVDGVDGWPGSITRSQAIKILDRATDKDDPHWEFVVDDFYDEDSDTMPSIFHVFAAIGVTEEEYREAAGVQNIDWPASATPSVPENEIKARGFEEYANLLETEAHDLGEDDLSQSELLMDSALDARSYATRLRTAGDEGESQ